MAGNGVKSTTLSPANSLDELLGNRDGSTARVSIDALILQFLADTKFIARERQFKSRDNASALAGKALGLNIVFMMAGLLYTYDNNGTACDDIGVPGIAPVGFTVDFLQFGCAGNGVTNDYTRFVACLQYAEAKGLTIDGGGRVYKINSQITAKPGTLHNLTIDASGIPAAVAWPAVGAEYEAAKSLTGDLRQTERVVPLVAHNYSVGDLVMIQSALVIETGTNSQAAHFSEITEVTADTFTTLESAKCNLLLAHGAYVRRLPKVTADVRQLHMIGGGICKDGLWLKRFYKPVRYDNTCKGMTSRAFLDVECYKNRQGEPRSTDGTEPGLGYGTAFAGCAYPWVDGADGSNQRHTITCGASGVIPTILPSVGDGMALGALSGGIDAHPAVLGHVHNGRMLIDAVDKYAGEDGAVIQSIGGNIDVVLRGKVNRHGVILQPSHVTAAFDIAPSFQIRVWSEAIIPQRLMIADLDGCGDVEEIEVDVHGKSVLEAVYFDLGPVKFGKIAVGGNGRSTTTRALRILSEATSKPDFCEISGRWICAANEAVYVTGPTDAGSDPIEVSYTSGQAKGGAIGLRAIGKAKVTTAAHNAGSNAAELAALPATITVLTGGA